MTDSVRPIRVAEDITPEWLTAVLRADGSVGDGRVVEVDRRTVGNGLMGVCVRVGLTTERAPAGAPTAVVVKLAAPDERVRQMMGPTGYAREVCFYRHLAPTVPIRAPRCSYAALDGNWCTLVLEDLAPAEPADQLAGCTPDQVALAVHELVGLHATRWGDPGLLSHPCLVRHDDADASDVHELMRAAVPGFIERFAGVLDDAQVRFYERLGATIATWGPAARSTPVTLEHGDFRPDNLMFGTAAGGPPVAVVDWQAVTLGNGIKDVGFVIGGSLGVDERRANEEAILRDYHHQMTAAGLTRSWDECRADYRAGVLSAMYTVVLGAMYSVRTERGDAMLGSMAQRHAQQALDLGSDALFG